MKIDLQNLKLIAKGSEQPAKIVTNVEIPVQYEYDNLGNIKVSIDTWYFPQGIIAGGGVNSSEDFEWLRFAAPVRSLKQLFNIKLQHAHYNITSNEAQYINAQSHWAEKIILFNYYYDKSSALQSAGWAKAVDMTAAELIKHKSLTALHTYQKLLQQNSDQTKALIKNLDELAKDMSQVTEQIAETILLTPQDEETEIDAAEDDNPETEALEGANPEQPEGTEAETQENPLDSVFEGIESGFLNKIEAIYTTNQETLSSFGAEKSDIIFLASIHGAEESYKANSAELNSMLEYYLEQCLQAHSQPTVE